MWFVLKLIDYHLYLDLHDSWHESSGIPKLRACLSTDPGNPRQVFWMKMSMQDMSLTGLP